eukprot:scaffold6922_cov363-Prasinococcus_capsulatus_cf.AAC.4
MSAPFEVALFADDRCVGQGLATRAESTFCSMMRPVHERAAQLLSHVSLHNIIHTNRSHDCTVVLTATQAVRVR